MAVGLAMHACYSSWVRLTAASWHPFFAPFLCTFSATLQLLHLVFAVVGRAPEVPVGRDVVVGLRQHLVAVVAPEALLVVGQPAGADTVVLVHLHEVGPESGTTPPPPNVRHSAQSSELFGGVGGRREQRHVGHMACCGGGGGTRAKKGGSNRCRRHCTILPHFAHSSLPCARRRFGPTATDRKHQSAPNTHGTK